MHNFKTYAARWERWILFRDWPCGPILPRLLRSGQHRRGAGLSNEGVQKSRALALNFRSGPSRNTTITADCDDRESVCRMISVILTGPHIAKDRGDLSNDDKRRNDEALQAGCLCCEGLERCWCWQVGTVDRCQGVTVGLLVEISIGATRRITGTDYSACRHRSQKAGVFAPL